MNNPVSLPEQIFPRIKPTFCVPSFLWSCDKHLSKILSLPLSFLLSFFLWNLSSKKLSMQPTIKHQIWTNFWNKKGLNIAGFFLPQPSSKNEKDAANPPGICFHILLLALTHFSVFNPTQKCEFAQEPSEGWNNLPLLAFSLSSCIWKHDYSSRSLWLFCKSETEERVNCFSVNFKISLKVWATWIYCSKLLMKINLFTLVFWKWESLELSFYRFCSLSAAVCLLCLHLSLLHDFHSVISTDLCLAIRINCINLLSARNFNLPGKCSCVDQYNPNTHTHTKSHHRDSAGKTIHDVGICCPNFVSLNKMTWLICQWFLLNTYNAQNQAVEPLPREWMLHCPGDNSTTLAFVWDKHFRCSQTKLQPISFALGGE